MSVTLSCQCHTTHWGNFSFFPCGNFFCTQVQGEYLMSVTVSCQCHNTHWEKFFFFPLQKVYLSTRGVIDACRCQLSVSYYTLEKVLLFSFVESFPVYNGRKLIPVTVSRQCHITHLGKFFFFPLQKVFLSTRDLHHRPACHLSCQINGGKQINYNPQGSYNEPCIFFNAVHK